MSEHVADVRVVSVQPCVYVLHHTTFSMVASVYSGLESESSECANPLEFADCVIITTCLHHGRT